MSRRSEARELPLEEDAEQNGKIDLSAQWWWYVSIGAAAIALGLGFLGLFDQLARPLALIFMAVVVAMAFAPVVEFFARWLPRTVSILVVYVLFILVFVGIGFIIFPPLINQAQEASSEIPNIVDQIQTRLDQFQFLDSGTIVEGIRSQLGNLTSTLVRIPLAIVSSLLDILLILVISVYWLILLPRMKDFFLSLFPNSEQADIGRVLAKMGQTMGGYIRGTIINAFVVAILTYIALLIIGLDFPLVLSLLAGLLEIIPVLGPIITGVILVLFALLQSTTMAIIVLVFQVVMQQLENHILVPNIMQSQAEISPLLVILALFAGASLGGLLGALVAIPLAGALNVLVVEALVPLMRRWTGAPDSADSSKENERKET